jgi:hypothetical protein
MATRIYVLCRSDAPFTYGELEDYINHWGWLDSPARFEPLLNEQSAKDTSWSSFEVYYHPDQRAIRISRRTTSDEMEPVLSDIDEQLEDVDDSDRKRDIEARIKQTRQLFTFEVPGDPPEDVWEMLSATEALIARERDGIIFADEGVYDAEMNQLLAFSE